MIRMFETTCKLDEQVHGLELKQAPESPPLKFHVRSNFEEWEGQTLRFFLFPFELGP